MDISWYSIKISRQTNTCIIFKGYFTVDNSSNLVTAFYETIDGSTDFSDNILGPSNMPVSYADNLFINGVFSSNGTNFTSYHLQTLLSSPSPYYNIFELTLFQSYNITNKIIICPIPISNICFPAGTPIRTNQGDISIDQINPAIHTIRNKRIVGITKTITQDKYLVCFEKDAIGPNIPSRKTIISQNHEILYKGKMVGAYEFADTFKNVHKIKYNGEILYNVLMEEHDKMVVNNMICETLHPENGIAKIYKYCKMLNPEKRREYIDGYNKHVKKHKTFIKG